MAIKFKEQYLCDLPREAFIDFFAQHNVGSGSAKAIFKTLYTKPLKALKPLFENNKHLNADDLCIDLLDASEKKAEDQSSKFIVKLSNKESVEAVRMPIQTQSSQRVTACVSSQVGCALDCSFCVTGTLGLKRNLKTWEIVEQILSMNQLYPNNPVSNVVFMGMGEPFYNYEAVKKATHILSDHMGLNIARKRITVSTAGVVPKIKQWAAEGKTNLAISLISCIENKRTQLMSINKKYNLSEVIQSIEYYTQITGKKVLCEYILIKDVTDGSEDIQALVNHLKDLNITLNLIPYNENNTLKYARPEKETILQFRDELRKNNIFSTIRWSYGSDIDAACGQLNSES